MLNIKQYCGVDNLIDKNLMNLVKPGIFKDKLSSRRMETNLADNTYFELHDTQDDNLQSEKNNVFKCLGKKDAN